MENLSTPHPDGHDVSRVLDQGSTFNRQRPPNAPRPTPHAGLTAASAAHHQQSLLPSQQTRGQRERLQSVPATALWHAPCSLPPRQPVS